MFFSWKTFFIENDFKDQFWSEANAMFYLGLDVQPEIPILKELYSIATAYVDGST